jgi:hypothetical protein
VLYHSEYPKKAGKPFDVIAKAAFDPFKFLFLKNRIARLKSNFCFFNLAI